MHNRITHRDDDILFVALIRHDGERYMIFYDHATRAEALRTLGRWASEPTLGFTWYDAAKLSQRVRRECLEV